MPHRRWYAIVAAGVLFAACGTSSTSRPADGGNDGGGADRQEEIRSVVVVGDSITKASEQEITAALATIGVTDVVVDAEVGRRIEVGTGKGAGPLSGVRTIFTLLSEGADPDAWVIALGTNDVGSYPDATAYGALIDQILDMLPTDTPLAWVNTYRPQYLDHTQMFNDTLDQRLDARGAAVVADWFGVASSPDADVLRSDDLHPNDDGQAAFALLVVQAVQRL